MTLNKYIDEQLKTVLKPESYKLINSLIKDIKYNDYDIMEILLFKFFAEKLDLRIKGTKNGITLEGTGETLTCIVAMFKNISSMVKNKNIDKAEILDLFKYYLNK